MAETLVSLGQLYQGDTLQASIPQQLEPDGTTPIDITGATCTLTLKTSRTDATELYSQADVALTDAVNGNHTFVVAAANTQNWPFNTNLYYDMVLQDAAGIVTTIQLGTLLVLDPIHN